MASRPLHDPEYAVVVQVLRDLRHECGFSQVELAQRLGVDQSFVSKVERKERRLDVAELRRACLALGTSLGDFVERLERTFKSRRKGMPR